MKTKSLSMLLALFLSILLVLSGCGDAAPLPDSGQEQQPSTDESKQQAGGELSYALATSPDTLDPARSGWAVAIRVYRTIFDNLVTKLPDHTIKPWLATEWTESADGKSYTFKLRQDVTFHDGTPFNAEAVKFTFDRIIDPATKSGNARAQLLPYESSEVIDEFTIKLNLSRPSASFLGNLSQGGLGIVSPTAVAKYGEQFGQNPVGTGPFKFVKWEENLEVQVERNPDYRWAPEIVDNKGAAYLDRIVFKIVPEEATRIGSVQSKQILAAETVPPQNIVTLEKDPNFQLLKAKPLGLPFTLFINQKKAPWNELEMRQALQYGINVKEIVQTLYLGTYEQAWTSLVPGMIGYNDALEGKLQPDANKAGQLLDQQGWVKGADGIREKDGKKLTLHYVEATPNREKRQDIATMVQQQLKKIGIDVKIELTNNLASVVYTNGNYDIHGNSQVNGDSNALTSFYHTPAEGERAILPNLSIPEIDSLLDEGAVTKDEQKRADIYKQVQQLIHENAAIIPIYVFPYTVATVKNVEGIKFDLLGYPLFNDVKIN